MCQSASQWVLSHETSWTLQITILHRSSPNLPTGRCWHLLVSVEIQKTHVCQTGNGINFYHSTYRYGKIALVSNGARYHDGVSGSQRWNHLGPSIGTMTFDLGWPWTVLGESLKLHIKCLKNDDRYDVRVNRSRIRNHPWPVDLHHDLWPWMTLNCPRSRSQNFRIKYLEYCERYSVRHNGGQLGNQQCAC